MKLLLLLVALGFCSASLENKRVLVGEDGNVAISNSYGRVISITKPFGPGGKTIEIDVSGPYVPTKRIYVDNTNVSEDSIDDLDFNRAKRGSKVPIKTQGDILTQIFEAYKGVVDETSYQKLLAKVEKYVTKGLVSPVILDLLRNLGSQNQEVLIQNPWLLQQPQLQSQQHIILPQGVEVQGGYPGYGLGGQFWNSVYQGQYPLGQYQLGQYSQGYPNVYGQNQGGVPIVGQGEYGSQYPEGSSYLYPEHQGYSQQSSVPVSSWWRRYLNPYTQQHQLGQGVYQGAEQYLGNLQGGYQSEYPYGQWQGQYPVWGQHGVQGGIEQQGQYYQPSSYLWRRLLSPVERQRIQQYVWGRLGQVQGVLGQGYPSIWNGLLSGSGLSGQQGQGVYGGIGQYVTPQVVV